jgi:hypothetical protein
MVTVVCNNRMIRGPSPPRQNFFLQIRSLYVRGGTAWLGPMLPKPPRLSFPTTSTDCSSHPGPADIVKLAKKPLEYYVLES